MKKQKEKLKQNKGITLIALVITIIVLLILAAVSIAMLTGENGILNQASKAKEETEIAKYKEALDVIRPGIEVEKYTDKLTSKEYMDRYEEEIKKDKTFERATVTREDDETIKVVTKEGYTFIVTEEKTEYQGKGEVVEPEPEEPPVYEEGDIAFSYNPTTMTNKDVQVTITKNVEENYTIEYSKYDTNNWEEYTGPVDMEKNGAIYARLKNSSGSSESYATGNVAIIDKLAPNEPSIVVGEVTENSIQVTASSTDKEETEEYASSGIKGYQFSKDEGKTWEPATEQTSGTYIFTGLTEDTEYKIKVRVVDNAGNETVSSNATTQKTESGEIIAGDIENNGNIYGSEVKGYECTNSAAVNKWLIFYADSNNIYLISDDYIPYEYIPTNSKGHKPSKGGSYERDIYFTDDFLNDYSGSSDIKDDRIKALNNDYFNTKGFSSTNYNMRAIAYLLDIETWKVFAGSKAEYAIGGPSIELFLKSYNKKYGTSYVAEAKNEGGYEFGADSSSMSTNFIFSNTIDPLYVKSSSNLALACILTSTGGGTDIMIQSGINNNSDGLLSIKPCFMSGYGVRPIVCLKSDTKLEKNSDGSYVIK